ncbi:hypothetical protein THIARS_70941 [Thiomonas delicata]|uniref:Uncharacterized protein n=1 Tax=Thiomonas delicata TaxID=364030 RepID=A0A238D7X6_THIDL|nr:hypothetical protein THIARS_70941 [Thiomonas delicata]
MHDEPLPHDRKALDLEHGQAPHRQFEFERMQGQDAQAQTRFHRLLDRLVAAHFHHRMKLHAVPREMPLGRFARSRAGLAGDEGFAFQVLERDSALPHQRMRRRGNHDERVVEKGLGDQLSVLWRLAHDRQILVRCGQHVQDLFLVRHLQPHLHFGVPAAECSDQLGREVVRCARHHQIQFASAHAAEFLHGRTEVLHFRGNDHRVAMQLATGVGGLDLFADLVEQRHADLLFELPHLHRYGRLRQMQGVSRTRETLAPHDGVENLELAQGQMHRCDISIPNTLYQKLELRFMISSDMVSARESMNPSLSPGFDASVERAEAFVVLRQLSLVVCSRAQRALRSRQTWQSKPIRPGSRSTGKPTGSPITCRWTPTSWRVSKSPRRLASIAKRLPRRWPPSRPRAPGPRCGPTC